jgi:hypothetical protein
MANKQVGDVPFTVGDEIYTLRLDVNALAEMEDALSTDDKVVTSFQVMARAERGQISALRAVMWAGLRRHHPKITLDEAGDLIQRMGGPAGVEKTLKQATTAAMPESEEGPRKKRNPPQARTASGRGDGSTSEHAA